MSRLQEVLDGTTLAGKGRKGLAFFTICSNNYLPVARILIDSARRFHPEAAAYLCLVDEMVDEPGFYAEDCTVVVAGDLDIPDMRAFLFRYDIMELNTAVKPFMFQHLLAAGHDAVLYFDPDIEVFTRLDQVLAALTDGASFVLTPHLCQPAEDPAFPDDISVMVAGVYNLGFLGVGACAEAETILAWWARRLQYQCYSDQARGIFVDQKFMDLLPGFAAEARIMRDTTLNVAYWNLSQRVLRKEGDGWTVDGRPLGFYHFSGFNPAHMKRLTKHTKAFSGDAMPPVLAGLLEHYAAQLRAHGHGRVPSGTYAYGRFASGRRIPLAARKAFRERHDFWPGNPFETFEAHLQAPMPGCWMSDAAAPVTNLMGYLHETTPGLGLHFDLQTPDGVDRYAAWFVTHGEELVENTGLTEPVAERLGRRAATVPQRPPEKRAAAEADINVIGYLRAAMGLGEAGRLNLRALNYAGLNARGLETYLNSSSQRTDTSCDSLIDADAQGRFHLFNVNFDQLPLVMKYLRPLLRQDAYRIMAPFWELSILPEPWRAAADDVDEVWAPTRFIQATLAKSIAKPVLLMPLMLTFEAPGRVDRRHFGLPDDGTFLFFFAFDYFSFIQRKNPMAVVASFKRAFREGGRQGRVRLVLKTLNAGKAPEAGKELRALTTDDPDIILVEKDLSREDTLALIASCDAVVSLHRSEGLGLLIAEAMVLGKPVISTDYSATTELVTPRTGWPVDCRLIDVEPGAYPFHEGQVWADADIDHAAWQMRQVMENPAEAERRVAAARDLIERDYGMAAVSQRQLGRLRHIEGRPL